MTTAGLDEMGGGVRLLSLCSGYGGLDLAVEATLGAETVAYAEVDPHAAAIFARHWDAPNLGDLTQITWDELGPVDVVTAGYPCQPFSHAGKREGEDDERHLWPHIAEGVRALRPRYVVLENVRGHLSLGFGRVVGDLADSGYCVRWTCLRAADVGAPHGRDRVFIVATDPNCGGWERWGAGDSTAARRGREGRLGGPARTGSDVAADADGQGPQGQRRPSDPQQDDGHAGRGVRAASADTANLGHERSGSARRRGAGSEDSREPTAWGIYTAAIRRWEAILGRPAPPPTDDRGRLAPPFVEWLMGLPAGWVTNTPDLSRAQQLKILGNGVVPQQAAAALRLLLDAREVAA